MKRILLALLVAATAVLPMAGTASAQDRGSFYREAVLADAMVITIDAAGDAAAGFAPATLAAFQLDCTEDSGTATLDVAIQRSVDGGATWADVVTFTQLSATGGETKLYADVRAASAQMIGDRLRAEFDIGGSGQYTCTVNVAAEA